MSRDLLPMRGPDTCPVCGGVHGQMADEVTCAVIDVRTGLLHGHRLIAEGRGAYSCPAHRCKTRITAPRNPQPTKGDTMTTTPAVHHPQQPLTELAIRDDQKQFDKYQLAALRTRGIENVPTPELMVFFHHCKTRGLDPLATPGHATIVPYREKDGSKRWTIITEIDGYRYLGHREANRRGDIIAMPDPVYVDQAGNESTHWVKPPTEPPGMVKVTILKNGAPFAGEANYWEFGTFARNKDGTKDYTRPQGMTRDMPANQTRKCAEVQAWRMAYRDVFRDLPMEINVQAEPAATPWHVAATASSRRTDLTAGPADRILHAEADGVSPLPADKAVEDAALITQRHFERIGIDDPDEQMNMTAALAGLDYIPDTLLDFGLTELRRINGLLKGCDEVGQVHALKEAGDKPGT